VAAHTSTCWLKLMTACLAALFSYFHTGLAYVCPPGWIIFNNKCYYISSETSHVKTQAQAETICSHMQADLFYLESQSEMVSVLYPNPETHISIQIKPGRTGVRGESKRDLKGRERRRGVILRTQQLFRPSL